MTRKIFAIGGGGFSILAPAPTLDQYFLRLTGRVNPKVCYIPTASGDSISGIMSFQQCCMAYGAEPSTIELFRDYPQDLTGFLLGQDAVFVGGGNTHNMLLLWQDRGLDLALRKAYDAGVVMGGVSAGANCWFEQSTTDSWPWELRVMPGMAWLAGSFCPHYDEEAERRPSLEGFLLNGQIKPGYAADGKVGLLFQDEKFVEAVSAVPSGRACHYTFSDSLHEEFLIVRRLSDPDKLSATPG